MTTPARDYGRLRCQDRQSSSYSVSDYGDIDEKSPHIWKKYVNDEKPILHTSSTETSTHKSISHNDHQLHKFYKPTSNRSWVLASFLLVIALCIALLECAVATHPNARTIPKLSSRDVSFSNRDVIQVAQQNSAIASVPLAAAVRSPLDPPSRITRSIPIPTPTVTTHSLERRKMYNEREDGAGVSSSYTMTSAEQTIITQTTTPFGNDGTGPLSTTEINPGEPYRGDQLSNTVPTTDKPTTTGDTENLTGQPVQPSQMTITSSDEALSKTTVGQPPPESQMSIQDPASAATGANAGQSTSAGAPLTSILPDGAVSSQAFESAAASLTAAASVLSGSLIASGGSILGTLILGDTSATNAAVGIATLTNEVGKATATLSFTGNFILTSISGTKTVFYSKPSASISSSGATSTANSVNDSSSLLNQRTEKFTQFTYFVAMYVPNIIGVILQSAWLVVFATFKMMEPFYQLASPGGASAQATLTADYLSTGLSLSFTRAAFANHWVMLLAGQVQFCLAVVVLLVSESMKVVPTAYCKTEISDHQPCSPKWVVNISIIRAMEVFLVACFSMVLMIMVLNRRRVSGVYADPSRIATMADILVHKPLIQEIRDLPASATKSQVEIDLRDSRYMLGTFTADDKEQYGIIKLDSEVSSLTKEPVYKSIFRRLGSWIVELVENATEALPFLADIICMLSCFVLFMLITVYKILPGKDKSAYNSWMSSGQIGPNLVLSSFAVSIGFLVKRKERLLRLSHPYVLLAKGPQPASETITAGTRATQFTALWKGFFNGDISLALLSLAAIFSDIMLIIISGVPFSNAQTRPMYLASTYTCMVLLAFIFVVQIRITFKEWRRGHTECPDTLAAVLMRLCASRFVEEKNKPEEWNKELGSKLTAEFGEDNEHKQKKRYAGVNGEKRYRFGCMEGVDGIQRYMIEEDVWPRR